MHELALSQGVLELLQAEARTAAIGSIQRVVLEVGTMAGVEVEALRFCFDAVTRETLAQGATLEIVSVPAKGGCNHCRASFPIQSLLEACPDCGAFGVHLLQGTELRVKEFEGEPAIVGMGLKETKQSQGTEKKHAPEIRTE